MSKESEVRVYSIPPEDRLVCTDCEKDYPASFFKCFRTITRDGRREEETYYSQWCLTCRRNYAQQKFPNHKGNSPGQGSYWDRRHQQRT